MIGEGLCPFAHPVFDTLKIEVCEDSDLEGVTTAFMTLLQTVADADPQEIPTALFVIPNALFDFDEFWNWSLICDNLLLQMGHEGVIQLATFHPHYLFDGEDEDDMSNYTNRAPYATLHLIREADMEDALASVSKPERIPERNRQHMRRLGLEGLLKVMPALANSRVFDDHGQK